MAKTAAETATHEEIIEGMKLATTIVEMIQAVGSRAVRRMIFKLLELVRDQAEL